MDESELYTMLLLADGNLPTGSFVASSGLESYIKHGFFGSSSVATHAENSDAVINFIRDGLGTYARSALPFVSDAHEAVRCYYETAKDCDDNVAAKSMSFALERVVRLDALYHSMTLNEVTRRASKAQGVALLTL